MNRKAQPEVRFSEFDSNWKLCKAKEIFKPIVEKGKEHLPVLSVTQNNGVVYREDVGIDIKYDPKTLSSYKVIHPGDFVISLRSFQGGFELSDKLGITSPAYTIFGFLDKGLHDYLFWRSKFKLFTFIESLKTVTFGIRDGKSISFTEFSDLKIFFPYKKEQEKIGNFFKQLDDTITLQERELALLREQKKGFLQKMFPKEGSQFPEVRFPGFTGAWEERKLGELSESFEYGLNEAFDFNKLTYLRITDIDESSRKFISNTLTSPDINLASADNYKLQKGDILFARTGASVGKSYYYQESDGLVYYAGFLIRARIKSQYSHDFVFQNTLTNAYNKFIQITSQRSGQPGINAEEYSNFKILVPNYYEQQKIGSFFKHFDDTIALQERKLEKLKEVKKGFLQKMFV